MIIDAQVHVWGAESAERPWVKEIAHYVHRPHYTPHELLVDMREVGIDATVLVPPNWDTYANDLAIGAAMRHPNRFAVMALPDLDSPSVRDDLDRMLEQSVVKGVRVAFWDDASSAGLDRGELEWLWSYLEERRVPTAMFVPHRLTAAARIAREHPGLPIALCHLAMYHRQENPPVREQTDRLLTFVDIPNVSLKASAFPTASVEPFPHRDLREAFARLFDAFGPARMFWGTDVTRITKDGYSYSDCLRFMADLEFLDPESRGLIMGQAIQRWLDWPAADGSDGEDRTP